MPSTFTSNTGIELLADGEQAGAWGQTTNDNFDIIDRALNGSVSISLVGTTHTLTTSDGVLSDGQAAVLVFTGSPSGTNTVTIAPNTAQKTYFVTNSTAQTVVLSQGSGANVSVPAGLSKIVFTNGAGAGAAVFDITNTLSGNLTGNAATATALQNARTIGGVSFNGTANINLPGVNIAGNQNTTGSAATATLAASATALQTARTIGGVSFNGTANINLPGVNQAGNQNTTGNAGTATALQTARTIGGVSFNGTANINLPGVNIGGNQNTTGSAASLTTARTFTIGNTGKTFNGTANVAWSLAEIGVTSYTDAQARAAQAGHAAGGVGSYAFLGVNNDHTSTFGQTRAGSQLFPAGISAESGFAFNGTRNVRNHAAQNSGRAGTWRCMGVVRSLSQPPRDGPSFFGASLWLRIS